MFRFTFSEGGSGSGVGFLRQTNARRASRIFAVPPGGFFVLIPAAPAGTHHAACRAAAAGEIQRLHPGPCEPWAVAALSWTQILFVRVVVASLRRPAFGAAWSLTWTAFRRPLMPPAWFAWQRLGTRPGVVEEVRSSDSERRTGPASERRYGVDAAGPVERVSGQWRPEDERYLEKSVLPCGRCEESTIIMDVYDSWRVGCPPNWVCGWLQELWPGWAKTCNDPMGTGLGLGSDWDLSH